MVIDKLIRDYDIPLTTYEEYCHKPEIAISKLGLPQDVIRSIDVDADLQVKDYPKQKLLNQNQRQISKLNEEEINCLVEVFLQHEELLERFGYAVYSFG